MNLTDKWRGDDRFNHRLLSYLNEHFPFQINTFIRLRKNVYIAKVNDLQFIIKGFLPFRRLKIQEAFTHSLKKAGFPYTYSFYTFLRNKVYMLDRNTMDASSILRKGINHSFIIQKKVAMKACSYCGIFIKH